MSGNLKMKVVDGSTLEKTEMKPVYFANDAEKHAYIMDFLTGKED